MGEKSLHQTPVLVVGRDTITMEYWFWPVHSFREMMVVMNLHRVCFLTPYHSFREGSSGSSDQLTHWHITLDVYERPKEWHQILQVLVSAVTEYAWKLHWELWLAWMYFRCVTCKFSGLWAFNTLKLSVFRFGWQWACILMIFHFPEFFETLHADIH